MTRKKAREKLMQYIFQIDALDSFDNNQISEEVLEELGDQQGYFAQISDLLCKNIKSVDEKINEYAKKWTTTRMPKVDLAICRLATCEILYMSDEIPVAISINEAVELAKTYSTEQSFGYINAVLGKIANKNE